MIYSEIEYIELHFAEIQDNDITGIYIFYKDKDHELKRINSNFIIEDFKEHGFSVWDNQTEYYSRLEKPLTFNALLKHFNEEYEKVPKHAWKHYLN